MLVVMHRAGLGRCFMTEGLQKSVRSSFAWAGRFVSDGGEKCLGTRKIIAR